MKRIVKILLALVIVSSLSACVKKIDESKETYMYPAFKLEKNKKIWGYIDPKGEFVVEPKYDMAYDFTSEGLAKVEKDGLSGVINSQGREILEPKYQMVYDFHNGYFVAFDGNKNQLFNYEGNIQLLGENKYIHIGPHSDGLFAVAIMDEENQIKMGYIGKSGTLVIDPEYARAYDFIDGKAIVQDKEEDNFKIIDKDNKLVKELEYKEVRATPSKGVYVFKGNNELYGLLDSNGDIIIEDKFENIEDMEGDHIVVNLSKNEEKEYGIIDRKEKYIIQPEYKDIILLGDGYFALSKELDESGNNVYAISNSKGDLITEYKYYNVGGLEGKLKKGLISVFDGENTYAIDLKGNKSDDIAEMSGPGEVSFDGKVVKADISGKRSYYNKNKELIWEETNDYILKDDAIVKEERYLDGKVIDIRYPIIDGLKSKEAEDKINEKLYGEFRKTYDLKEEINSEDYKSYKTNYSVNRINDLLLIEQVVEVIGKEDIEPIVWANIYNINLSNGNFYELKDLFKQDLGYLETLTDIVRGIAEQKNEQGTGMYDLSNWEGVKEDQDVIAQLNTIDIYFKPDEILSYSEQFPKFTIEQEAIDDILDYNSEFWWTFSISKGF